MSTWTIVVFIFSTWLHCLHSLPVSESLHGYVLHPVMYPKHVCYSPKIHIVYILYMHLRHSLHLYGGCIQNYSKFSTLRHHQHHLNVNRYIVFNSHCRAMTRYDKSNDVNKVNIVIIQHNDKHNYNDNDKHTDNDKYNDCNVIEITKITMYYHEI